MHHAAELRNYFYVGSPCPLILLCFKQKLENKHSKCIYLQWKFLGLCFFFEKFFLCSGDLTITTHLSVFPLGNKAIFYVHLFDLVFFNLFKI